MLASVSRRGNLKPREVKVLPREPTARPGRAKIQNWGSGSESSLLYVPPGPTPPEQTPPVPYLMGPCHQETAGQASLCLSKRPPREKRPGWAQATAGAHWTPSASNHPSPVPKATSLPWFPPCSYTLPFPAPPTNAHSSLCLESFSTDGSRSLFQCCLHQEALPDHLPLCCFLPPCNCLEFLLADSSASSPMGPPEGAAPHPPRLTTSWALLCSSKAWAACCCRYRNSCCRRKCCCEKSCSCCAWCRGLRPGGYRAGQRGGTVARSISSAAGTQTACCTCGLMLHHHAHLQRGSRGQRGATHIAGSWALQGPWLLPRGRKLVLSSIGHVCTPGPGTQPCPHPGWDVPTA